MMQSFMSINKQFQAYQVQI